MNDFELPIDEVIDFCDELIKTLFNCLLSVLIVLLQKLDIYQFYKNIKGL